METHPPPSLPSSASQMETHPPPSLPSSASQMETHPPPSLPSSASQMETHPPPNLSSSASQMEITRAFTNHKLSLSERFSLKLRAVFQFYGKFVAKYHWALILISCLFIAVSSVGLIKFRMINDARKQFTPEGARSQKEQAVFDGFWQLPPKKEADSQRRRREITSAPTSAAALAPKPTRTYHEVFQLRIVANQPKGNILDHIADAQKLYLYLRHGLRDPVTNQSYEQLCTALCAINSQMEIFMNVYATTSMRDNINFQLTYPIMKIIDERLTIGSGLHSVHIDSATNRTILGAHFIQLLMGTLTQDPKVWAAYVRWKGELTRFIAQPDSVRPFNSVRTTFADAAQILTEIRRTALSLSPFMVNIGVVLLLFTIVTTVSGNWPRSKSFVAAFGIVVPLAGSACTYGITFVAGLPFQPVTAVSLYLVLAVGVDDVYLILHAWQRSKTTATDPKSVESRMSQTIGDAGPSITMTSLTNILSFSSGFFMAMPAMRSFCVVTSTAMLIGFILQLTLFAPVLALAGQLEHWLENRAADKNGGKESSANCLEQHLDTIGYVYNACLARFSEAIMGSFVRTTLLIVIIVYYALSGYGLYKMQVAMQLDRLIQPGSVIHDHLVLDTIRPDTGLVVNDMDVLVQHAGDLRNATRLQSLMKMIRELETSSRELMIGHDGTICWLRPFIEYLQFIQSNSPLQTSNYRKPFDYATLDQFLAMSGNAQYRAQLVGDSATCKNNHPDCVRRFWCRLAFYKHKHASHNIELLADWRRVVDRYPEFRAVTFYPNSYIMDQMSQIYPTTWRAVLMTLIMMTLVCVLFVPHWANVLVAGWAVLSINFGVIGFASHWGVDFDPIAMTALLSSVGFSVDYTAHISYHYYKAKHLPISDRLHDALQSMAWPSIQAGVSSSLSALIMLMHDVYFVKVFAKVMILVCILGLVHGLLVLPVVLTSISELCAPRVITVKTGPDCEMNSSSSNSSKTSPETTPSPELRKKSEEIIDETDVDTVENTSVQI